MECMVRNYKPFAIVTIAISWVLANTGWLVIGDDALVGTELVQLLNLLPAISLLLIFISSYRKLERTLMFIASFTMAVFVYLAVATDFSSTAAATKIYESLSGIQGAGPADVEIASVVSQMPLLTAAIAVISVGFSALSALKPAAKSLSKLQEVEDNRALWDEQKD